MQPTKHRKPGVTVSVVVCVLWISVLLASPTRALAQNIYLSSLLNAGIGVRRYTVLSSTSLKTETVMLLHSPGSNTIDARSQDAAGNYSIVTWVRATFSPQAIAVTAPVIGAFRVTGTENPECSGLAGLWTFCQHQTDLHRPGGGISGSDDTFAWDINLLNDADNGQPVYPVAPGRVVRYAGNVAPGAVSGAVLIEHTQNGLTWWSGYLHMKDISVIEDRAVTPATVLGKISNVCACGAIPNHLHFVAYEGANTAGGLVSRNIGFLQRVDTIDPSSVSSLYGFANFAGMPGVPGDLNGLGSAARFKYPTDVEFDGTGNAYLADFDNQTIRKMTPAGVVTTIAGSAGQAGSDNGTGSEARFSGPIGVAVDSVGNVYVADQSNHTVRKITPSDVVSTLAGSAGQRGSDNGTGSEARFAGPKGVAVDSAGDVYVADYNNHSVRKITPGGLVATFAGSAGQSGSANETGSTARFLNPTRVALDNAGNVYVADFGNHTIRKITPGGLVTTIAGMAGAAGARDGIGPDARFNHPGHVAVDSAGNVYVADSENNRISKGTRLAPLQFLSSAGGSNGSLHMRLTGPSGSSLVLERTADLQTWVPVQTYSIAPGGLDLAVPVGADLNRFFRARLAP